MKAHRHAADIGKNIVALQSPKETLPEFTARCNLLHEQHGEAEPVPTSPPTAGVMCESCGDTGQIIVGNRVHECQDCPAIEDQPSP